MLTETKAILCFNALIKEEILSKLILESHSYYFYFCFTGEFHVKLIHKETEQLKTLYQGRNEEEVVKNVLMLMEHYKLNEDGVMCWAIDVPVYTLIEEFLDRGAIVGGLKSKVLIQLINNGKFEQFKRFLGRIDFVYDHACLERAARHNRLEFVSFFLETKNNLLKISLLPLLYAIRNGNFEMVKLLVDRGVTIKVDHLKEAAHHDFLEILKYLRNHVVVDRYVRSELTKLISAAKGECLEYLISERLHMS